MFKKIISGIIVLSLAASTLVLPASARSFNQDEVFKKQQNADLQSGNNSSFSVPQQYMIDQGILKGNGNGNYNMSGYLNRGALMVMLVRAFGLSSSDNNAFDNFADVPSGSYYADAIKIAKGLGIAKGNGKSFSPNSYVTIRQALLFIERVAVRSGIILNLNLSYYDSLLNNYATRKDIANLLYSVLTGNDTWLDGTDSSDTDTADRITYTSSNGAVVNFDVDDFNDVIYDATDGESLSYVIFSLPSDACGTIYYDYSSSSSSNTEVSSSTRYYVEHVDQKEYLSLVTFVPSTTYTGTVTIRYTGYTNDGTAVNGTIQIAVNNAVANAFSYDYNTGDNYILLHSYDFSQACENALGNDYALSYVTFTLPSSSKGTLYYNYSSSTGGTAMTQTTECYLNRAFKVAFVNNSSNDSNVTISYTGHTTDGTVFIGTIDININ